MAISHNPLLKNYRGHIEKTVVVKQYPGDRTIITAYPDMSKVVWSEAQLAAKSKFGLAVAYAKNILANAGEKKLASTRLSDRKGKLYHALLAEFMRTK